MVCMIQNYYGNSFTTSSSTRRSVRNTLSSVTHCFRWLIMFRVTFDDFVRLPSQNKFSLKLYYYYTRRSNRWATVGPNTAHVKHRLSDDRASKVVSFDHRGNGGWVPSSVFEPPLVEPLHFDCASERAQVGDSIRSTCNPIQSRLIVAVWWPFLSLETLQTRSLESDAS